MLDITPDAMTQLRALQAGLTQPCLGLRIQLSGNACQGWQIRLGWTNRLLGSDLSWQQDGLPLIVERQSWSQLQGCSIRLAERQGQPGLSIQLAQQACQCDQSDCHHSPASSSPSIDAACGR